MPARGGGAAADRRRPRPRRRRAAAEAPRARRGRARDVEEAPPAPAERRVPDARFGVAFEDEHLLVVDKPAGVVVHPARRARERARSRRRWPAARAGGEDPSAPGIVHRLDRDTSGLLVVARSEDVHAALQQALRERRDHARVPRARRGPPAGAQRHDRRADRPRPPRAHADVHRHRRRRAARSRTSSSSRRCRRTRCCACGWRPAARTRSACTCRRSATRSPATPSTAARGALGLERQFLHAARLAFAHPVTGEPLDLTAPLPEDLARALRQRRRGTSRSA